MSADEDQRPYDSRTYRTSNNLVLHSSVPNELHQSAYLSSTTSDSVQPTIVLPAREFPSQFVTSHTQTDFNLPVRGRYEPQDQARRVSVAGFESQASNGTNPAHNDSASYYSAEDYQQAVAQFHARRSRSQPPKPVTGAFFPQHPPPSQAPAAMSAFTQILPSPSPHFGQGNDFYSTSFYSPHLAYDSMSALPNQSYFEGVQDQRPSTISPRLLPASPPYGSTTPRVSKAVSRSPPTRERTPIRHHRPSISRNRSGSRPEALLAYAEQQRAVSTIPSQSAPNTPPIYQQNAYAIPPTSTAAIPQTAYYSAGSMPPPQYLTTHSPYATDPNQTSYFGLTRSISQPALDIATLNPQDAMYLPNPNSLQSQSPPLGSSLQQYPPPTSSLESSPEGYRVLASRPKPQCFDHGCNGRQFSTFSNLLRHQREKSGSAMKAICPHCGTEFTRTTARNGHLWGGKCKGRDGNDDDGAGDDGPKDEKSD